ncbi:serine/threonine-protein kinase [Actinophytocola sp.]|uniref:serine/threonine-protein kinase n=1 Tax=Actinophytocola sp. TaxID=1872138 RepID=UPI002D7EFE66|nr:serine/threonine-protein kinase [Actinophytocola sp.]HET9142204.1 serine/threonine-protein kinase [Actinophytocola sp.]
MDTQTGHLLDGRYRLGSQIGRGGMATVHAAVDVRLRRPVAIKLFHRPAGAVALARLRSEAELLGGLSHPGLLKVFDISADTEQPYLVMQLVDGCTLRRAIDNGPLEPAVTARLGLRLAETLQYVHSRQIMHRDIKPSNVLLAKSGGCYLADFGIALAAGAARLTATGHCVGTAAYLAPEQVAGAETGPAADIYALGLVLLECLTGYPEYTGTEVEAAIARLSRPPHIPDSVPAALRTALLAMTARNPDERADAAGTVRLLASAAAGLSDHSVSVSTVVLPPVRPEQTMVLDVAPAPRRSWLTRRRLGHAVAASGVAAAATLLTLLVGGPDPVTPAAEQPPAQVETPASMEPVAPRQTAVSNVVVAPVDAATPVDAVTPGPNHGHGKPPKPGKGGKPGKG